MEGTGESQETAGPGPRGGANTEAGSRFQGGLGALLAAHVLLEEPLAELGLDPARAIPVTLEMQVDASVDDLKVDLEGGGRAFFQAKRSLGLNTGAESAFYEVVEQWKSAVSNDEIDPGRDRLVAACQSSTRDLTILGSALTRKRASRAGLPSPPEEKALSRLAGMLDGLGASEAERLLASAVIWVREVEDETGDDADRAQIRLAQSVVVVGDGLEAWRRLIGVVSNLTRLRQGLDRDGLVAALTNSRVTLQSHARFGRRLRFAQLALMRDLPTIRDVMDGLVDSSGASLYDLGVTRSSIAERYRRGVAPPPYVPRSADAELQRRLTEDRFVILAGASKAGKSRTALECAAEVLPDHRLLAPRDGSRVAELLEPTLLDGELDPDVPTMLWLDDVDKLLGRDSGLDRVLIADTLGARSGMRILGTVQRGLLAGTAADFLETASVVDLATELDDRELLDARSIYAHEQLADRTRIGEHFVAADQLVQRFVGAEDELAGGLWPTGGAVVAAAIDLRRSGISRPIPETALSHLVIGRAGANDGYLHRFRPGTMPTEADFSDGLARSQVPVASSVALLTAVPDQDSDQAAYEPFDYIVAFGRGDTHHDFRVRAIPASTWELVLRELVQPAESFQVCGYLGAAFGRQEIPLGAGQTLIDAFAEGVHDGRIDLFPAALFTRRMARWRRPGLLGPLVAALSERQLPTKAASTAIGIVASALDGRIFDEACSRLLERLITQAQDGQLPASGTLALAAMLIRRRRSRDALALVTRVTGEAQEGNVAPSLALDLLFVAARRGSDGVLEEFAPGLVSVVREGHVMPASVAYVARRLARRGRKEEAGVLVPQLESAFARGELPSEYAGLVAHALYENGAPEHADRLLDPVVHSVSKGQPDVSEMAMLVGRLVQCGRESEAIEIIPMLIEAFETQEITEPEFKSVTGRLIRAGLDTEAARLADACPWSLGDEARARLHASGADGAGTS